MRVIWIGLPLLAIAIYLTLAPIPVSPVAWQAPQNRGLTGDYSPNYALSSMASISIGDDMGPEDLATDSRGNLYVSVHSGLILRKAMDEQTFSAWANTGGRPLGIEVDSQDRLWIADAYLGLMMADTQINQPQVTLMSDSVDGTPIGYADDVDISPDGIVYFSDASNKFPAKAYGGTLNASLLDLMEHGGHGRLLRFDPQTAKTTVLLEGLQFANGVAMDAEGHFVLVNETGAYRVIKYWLQGPKRGQSEVLTDNLPGFPDNIAGTPDGHFWLGLASPRSGALDSLSAYPFLRAMVQRLPAFLRPQAQHYGHLVKLDASGKVLMSLQDPDGAMPMTTGAIEFDEQLFVSSLTASFVGVLSKP